MNNFDQWYEANLEQFLRSELPNHGASQPYHYVLKPWGKLFRPKLCVALAYDLSKNSKNDKNLMFASLALELHHSYSLVHDDLPAMDNDDMRRGRPSCHKQFNEWVALLTGDGLLNLSYRAISKIKSTHLPLILKLAAKELGPLGLIHGQYLDLSQESDQSTELLLLTHELKTGRLIQVSLLYGYILAQNDKQLSLSEFKKFYRLGKSLGVVFQLLDDLSELSAPINKHEKAVNPWPKETKKITETTLLYLDHLKDLKAYPALYTIVGQYLSKMKQDLLDNSLAIEKNVPTITSSLKLICQKLSN